MLYPPIHFCLSVYPVRASLSISSPFFAGKFIGALPRTPFKNFLKRKFLKISKNPDFFRGSLKGTPEEIKVFGVSGAFFKKPLNRLRAILRSSSGKERGRN